MEDGRDNEVCAMADARKHVSLTAMIMLTLWKMGGTDDHKHVSLPIPV